MSLFQKQHKKKEWDFQLLQAISLVILYFFFEEILFELPNSNNNFTIIGFGIRDYLIWLITLLLGLSIFLLWFWWSLKARLPVKIIYALIFILATLVQYGYWNSVHRLVSPNDLALIGTTTMNSKQAAFSLYFSWWGLLVCLPFFLTLILNRNIQKTGWKELSILLVSLLAAGVLLAKQNKMFSLGTSFTGMFQSIGSSLVVNLWPTTRELVEPLNRAAPTNNIVLIIDEGIRSDHLSINGYDRDTTPYLKRIQQARFLYSWGTISAGATCSEISNELLLTGIYPSARSLESIKKAPTVFQYGLAAGYKITYIDAQTQILWNGLSALDIHNLNWINTKTLGTGPAADLVAARIIRELVTKSSGNFIVLNKRGVHFMYEESYPKEWEKWTPLPPHRNYDKYPLLVINPYDNGILYTVDEFFRILLPDNNTFSNTAYIYTSDHAQTLFEDGISWSHCNNTIKEVSVPLLYIGRLSTKPDLDYRASHSNILPTILDLMVYPETSQTAHYQSSIFSDKKTPVTRTFLSGSRELIRFDP